MKTKYFNEWEFKQALSLVKTNPFEAKLKYEEYLKKYPKDYSAFLYYVSTLIILEQFEDAEKILDFVENIATRDGHFTSQFDKFKYFKRNILLNKLKMLSYQGKYEEFHELYLNNFQETKSMDMNVLDFYCKVKMGILNFDKRDAESYLFRQIIEYQESDFLEHIQRHLDNYNNELNEPNKNVFSPNFPINKVIEEIKKYIPSDKKLCSGYFENMYIFKYSECGRDNNKLTDYFKVICFNNTKEFITMCPACDCQNLPYIDLNYLINDKDNKIKKISQIEKFNRKYNCR